MGFIEETGSPELGIESKRTSFRLFDDDGALTQGILAHSNANGKAGNSVEIGGAQLLRVVRFFENSSNRAKLEATAKADEAETAEERATKASSTCNI